MDAQPHHRRLTRDKLLATLPDDGAPGRTIYLPPGAALPAGLATSPLVEVPSDRTGAAFFVQPLTATVVVPPFDIEEAADIPRIDTGPLVELLRRRRTVAAFLLRRGGYTMGVFRDTFLVDSKTDRRFVKNRHRKGGQSQRRFDRIREKQVHELYGMACEDLRETLDPYAAEIQHVFLGGDRQALIAFRKQCDYLDRTFGDRLMSRTLPVTSDPRRASLDGLPREIWSSDVYAAATTELA